MTSVDPLPEPESAQRISRNPGAATQDERMQAERRFRFRHKAEYQYYDVTGTFRSQNDNVLIGDSLLTTQDAYGVRRPIGPVVEEKIRDTVVVTKAGAWLRDMEKLLNLLPKVRTLGIIWGINEWRYTTWQVENAGNPQVTGLDFYESPAHNRDKVVKEVVEANTRSILIAARRVADTVFLIVGCDGAIWYNRPIDIGRYNQYAMQTLAVAKEGATDDREGRTHVTHGTRRMIGVRVQRGRPGAEPHIMAAGKQLWAGILAAWVSEADTGTLELGHPMRRGLAVQNRIKAIWPGNGPTGQRYVDVTYITIYVKTVAIGHITHTTLADADTYAITCATRKCTEGNGGGERDDTDIYHEKGVLGKEIFYTSLLTEKYGELWLTESVRGQPRNEVQGIELHVQIAGKQGVWTVQVTKMPSVPELKMQMQRTCDGILPGAIRATVNGLDLDAIEGPDLRIWDMKPYDITHVEEDRSDYRGHTSGPRPQLDLRPGWEQLDLRPGREQGRDDQARQLYLRQRWEPGRDDQVKPAPLQLFVREGDRGTRIINIGGNATLQELWEAVEWKVGLSIQRLSAGSREIQLDREEGITLYEAGIRNHIYLTGHHDRHNGSPEQSEVCDSVSSSRWVGGES